MRSSQVQSLKMTTAVCLALALQLFSVVNVHAAAVGARTNSAVSSGSRPNDSERADLESAIRPTPANPVEDEDAYAEYLADQIISFCERISKIPSQVISSTMLFVNTIFCYLLRM